MRIGVVQGAGNRQYAVAAAQVRHAGAAQVFWQMRQEGAGADVQAFAAKHVGVVAQLDDGRIQGIAGRVGRNRSRALLDAGDQQPRFFDRQ